MQWAAGYENVVSSEILVGLYEKNAAALNMELHDNKGGGASTDFGNVSHVIPGLHPLFALATKAENHSRGFTYITGKFSKFRHWIHHILWYDIPWCIPNITQAFYLGIKAMDAPRQTCMNSSKHWGWNKMLLWFKEITSEYLFSYWLGTD